MQQPPPMISMAPSSIPPANLTTEQIQKYLDENKKLILAILDNQNLGKLAECAQYQTLLQKNLMYLAAIADAQPQTPSPPVQVVPHPAMPQGGFYMQHPQAAAISQQQPGVFSPKMPIQFNNPHLMQEQQQQQQQLHQHHQQVIQAQMGNRSGGPREIAPQGGGNGGPPMTSVQNDQSKQDARDAGRSNADGQGGPAGPTIGAGSEEAK